MNQNNLIIVIFSLSMLVGLSGCTEGRADKENSASAQSKAPTPRLRVKAEIAKEGTLSLDSLRTGTTQASHRMQLVAKIGGTLNRRLVNRGDRVGINQLLFDIDDRMPGIDLRRAAAGLNGAESDLKQATRSFERAKRLLKSKGSVSRHLSRPSMVLRKRRRAMNWLNFSMKPHRPG